MDSMVEMKLNYIKSFFSDLEDETDPRKIFEFLYRNVHEVQPPTDLDQNNPNINLNNPNHNNNQNSPNIPNYNSNPNNPQYNSFNNANPNQKHLSNQHASLNQQADLNGAIQDQDKDQVYQPGEVYYKPIEQVLLLNA